jgi:hypothetical protein
MTTSIIKQSTDSITLQITIPFTRSMLDSEKCIQDALNDVGMLATKELLKTFDTEGDSIKLGSVKMTSKGKINKTYQTPYGAVNINRHVYQTSKGGATFCPLEQDARIILTSTPRFASQVSYKMAEMAAPPARADLLHNHNRKVSVELMQRLAEAVSTVVQIKEETWSYTIPEVKDTDIRTISIGLDGTCMLMCERAYRQAMVGTIALYDDEGERQHTMYIAAAPEYGKDSFKARLEREIERAKALYPLAIRIGIADGAHDNWDFLEKYTTKQTLDFYHAAEYLTEVADAIFVSQTERKQWLNDRCHELKHTYGAAEMILTEMKNFERNILNGDPISWINQRSDQESTRILNEQVTAVLKEEHKSNNYKKEGAIESVTLSGHLSSKLPPFIPIAIPTIISP